MGIEYQGTRGTPRLDLRAALLEFMQSPNDYIGTKIFPIFRTMLQASKYSAITRESLTQTADTKRAIRAKYNRGGLGAKDKDYSCVENGFEIPLDDGERKMYQNSFAADLAAAKQAMTVVLRGQEIRIAGKVFDTSVFTGSALYTTYASAPWTTAASDAIAQVNATKSKIRKNCGMKPNTMVLSDTNLQRLKALTCIKEAIKYTSRMTDQEVENALASLFGVKKMLVGNAVKNTAKEGQDFVSGDIWSDDYVFLGITADDGMDLTQPSVGRTMLWVAETPDNVTALQYREEQIKSDIFRSNQYTDEHLVDPYFGHLIKVTA